MSIRLIIAPPPPMAATPIRCCCSGRPRSARQRSPSRSAGTPAGGPSRRARRAPLGVPRIQDVDGVEVGEQVDVFQHPHVVQLVEPREEGLVTLLPALA